MIKINLLRYGSKRKRVIIAKRVIFFFLYTFIIIFLLTLTGSWQKGLIKSYEDKVGKKTAELKNEMKKVKKKVLLKKRFKLKEKQCSKLSGLKQCNKKYMDMIARISKASALSSTQLSEFTIGKKEVVIEGYGYSTFKIASFIREIKGAGDIKTARLKVVEKSTLKGFPKLKFKIICTKNT